MDATRLLLLDDVRKKSVETYSEKVKRLFGDYYIAHYPMSEASGDVADNYEGTAARDGAYTGVTLGQPGIGDGLTCPLFDGANDFLDIYSASFNTAWSQVDCAVMIWAKVFDADVWEDTTKRFLHRLKVDGANTFTLYRHTANDRLETRIAGTGDTQWQNVTSETTTDWMCLLLTVDEVANEATLFLDGVETEQDAFAGAWSGNLNSLTALAGADSTEGGDHWYGYLAHWVIGVGTGCATAIQAVRIELATV